MEVAVGWLRNLFAKLFGRQQADVQPQRPTPKVKHRNKKNTTRGPSEIKAEYQPQTLGFLLKHRPQPMPGEQAYDLNKPPEIAGDARDHLESRINQIPPMPEIWHRVQEILQQDDASAGDLGQCVAQDPVLTAQILKVCNSSAYAGADSAEVSNIPLAIARLGLDEASSIIFRSLAPDLGGSEQRKTEIRHIWFHSQAIAMVSRILAEPSHHLSRHDATLMGMLHDIGKLVVLHIASEAQLNRLKIMIDKGVSSLAAEHASLGYTHIDAGMMLALHWQLPRHVQRSIAFHHHPAVMNADQIPESVRHAMLVLHAAHLILQHHGYSDGLANELSKKQTEEPSKSTSIWHAHQRTCLHDTLRFMQQDMLISLESESFYEQIEADIKRLKLSFSDLFE